MVTVFLSPKTHQACFLKLPTLLIIFFLQAETVKTEIIVQFSQFQQNKSCVRNAPSGKTTKSKLKIVIFAPTRYCKRKHKTRQIRHSFTLKTITFGPSLNRVKCTLTAELLLLFSVYFTLHDDNLFYLGKIKTALLPFHSTQN